MHRRDVIVVGAGVMGAATAWQLARRGRSVTVLEQFESGHARGSSHGTSRIFRLAYPDPFYVALAREALACWGDLETESGVPLLVPTGTVDFGDADRMAGVIDALDAEGVALELLPSEVARERWPGIRFEGPACFQPGGGRVAAGAAVLAMLGQARLRGADVRFETPVHALEPVEDGVRVFAADAVYQAEVVVVAAGAWVAPLLEGLVVLPPLRVTQESVFHFAPREQSSYWPSFIHHDDTTYYGLETPGEGIKVAEHHTGLEVTPDSRDFVPDPGSRERVTRFVDATLPGLVPVPGGEATCLYTTTATEDFVVDRVGPLVVVSPCSGHGFKFAPLVGSLAADLVEGGGAVERFALPNG